MSNIVRYYTITQEREVKVSATSLIEAAGIANNAFNDRAVMSGKGAGTVLEPVRALNLIVRED